MYHSKFEEVKILTDANYPVILTGEKGSGKTTLIKQIAEALKLKFYAMSMTRQTTLSHLLGFMSINGNYIPSQLRQAVEHGGLMLLDELDASDPNVLLSLNTIENGYIAFPDGIVKCHKDFRICGTSNPQDQHHRYTGRSILDEATIDRFDVIDLPTDPLLEENIVGKITMSHITDIRTILKKWNSDKIISMRDSIRFAARSKLNLLDGFVFALLGKSDQLFAEYEHMRKGNTNKTQSECKTLDELTKVLELE